MELSRALVVAFALSQKRKAIVADALAGTSAVVYLTELDETARTEALRNTGVLLTFNTSKELRPGEAKLLDDARLIQFMIGGVDFIPLGELPEGAWWVEPVRHGQFRIDQPFLDLSNVIASPHNSAQGDGAHDISLRRAVENCRRALTGEAPLHLIGLDERLM
jgi:hypothetical protein